MLCGTASALGGLGVGGRVSRAQSGYPDDSFRPAEHGFGFRNWSRRDRYFDPPTSSSLSVDDRLRTDWRDAAAAGLGLDTAALPAPVVEAMARQLRLAVAHQAGTNGHCYGMVLAAQQYFERPESIPVDRPVASEIEDPTVPFDDPSAPVYEEILQLQADQYLRFRAWLGRRAMVNRQWLDLSAILRDVESVVDSVGTAALMLFDDTLFAHQVLAYDFERRDGGVTIPVYDPNATAERYAHGRSTIRVDADGDSPTMRPYGPYTNLLFNRYDQIRRATGRADAGPFDHLRVGPGALRRALFPLLSVLVDTDAVALTVVRPSGGTVHRVRGRQMDRTRGDHARVRSLYGAPPGTYRISVVGLESTDYELRVVAADRDGLLADATRADSLPAGEVDEYELELPETGTGAVRRASGSVPGGVAVGGAAVGGAAAGALGWRALRRRREAGSD